MPHKFNAGRRHKIARQKHWVTNWATYNESLRRRGDLTVWLSKDVQRLWSASRRNSRGGLPDPAGRLRLAFASNPGPDA
jgi:hypothetical protein